MPGDQIETNGIESPKDVGGVANQIGIGRDYPSSILIKKSARMQNVLTKIHFLLLSRKLGFIGFDDLSQTFFV